ncbi:anti-sigma factor [Jeongeupia naejangsanensis]|uniref:Anti-sigma factor n=1 Tax=Jeongeupia naejangsanensis TaxID=613195 RepID=A0ABS2BML8_9NEIS|nr:anti-sigma factor [Jeongeupia naejangsanensis]MBM3116864.1 anti-sigma factor [Jeongeupia naejangsanensis]
MRTFNPQLRDRLAGQYVLGSLRGPARRRFEKLMHADANLRRAVTGWEARLLPLANALPEVAPPPRVWRGIADRLRAREPVPTWSWRGLVLWRTLAGGFAAMLLAGVVIYPVLVQRGAEAQYLAVLQDPQAQIALLASATRDGRLKIKPLNDLRQVSAQKALELWALPDGGKPRSLGLIAPDGKTVIELKTQAGLIPALAVSLEPPGGSPTGQPTGPVLYSGKMLSI